jgi:hypothetical protein
MTGRIIWTPQEMKWKRTQVDRALEALSGFAGWLRLRSRIAAKKATAWGSLNMILGLPSAILAATAGLSALSDLLSTRWQSGLALVAAGLAAMLAFFRPEQARQKQLNKARGYSQLAVEIYRYVEIEAYDPALRSEAVELYKDAQERQLVVLDGRPLPERWLKGRPASPGDLDYSWLLPDSDTPIDAAPASSAETQE